MSFCLYNKKNITRRLEDTNFIFSWQKTIFYSLAALVRKILFCHSKIKFKSSRRRVTVHFLQNSHLRFHDIRLSLRVLFKTFNTQKVSRTSHVLTRFRMQISNAFCCRDEPCLFDIHYHHLSPFSGKQLKAGVLLKAIAIAQT